MLHKIFKRLFHQKKCATNNKSPQFQSSRASAISRNLSVNLTRIKNDFKNTDDLVIRKFNIGTDKGTQAALMYLEGMVNTDILVNQVLKSSMLEIRQVTKSKEPGGRDIFVAVKEMITASEVTEVSQWDRLVSDLLAGRAILLVDGNSQTLVIDAIGWQHRGVQQPVAESVIRGARDSFTESVKINITLIRRRLRDPSLKVEMWRPDEVAAGLLEGRFAIICDNSPFTSMHSPEDYYLPWVLATFFRFLCFVGTFTALTLPAVYIRTEGDIIEQIGGQDLDDDELLKSIQNLLQEEIQRIAALVIKKSQEEFKVDPLGLGEVVRKQLPKLWKEIEKDWQDIYFPNTTFQIKG